MPSTKPSRPLSPHLQVYRPQLTSVLSILHRATGVALALGLPVMVAWLVTIAANQPVYDMFTGLLKSPAGVVLLFGWSWAFFYHFCTGIRHLFWDAGFFLDIRNVYRTGWAAVGVSTLVTGYVWFKFVEGEDWKAFGIVVGEFIGAVIALAIAAGLFLWIMSFIPGKTKTNTSMRAPLAGVRGLGSAKEGVEHWWLQRLTAIALIPLSIYVVATFFINVVGGGYAGAVMWLSSPFAAVLMILFIGAGFHHAVSGLQVVIEDYVHCEAAKHASLITIKFVAMGLALLGSIAVIKTLFFVILATMIPNAPVH